MKEQPLTTLDFPILGIDIGTPYDLQRPRTTPEGVNVRGFEPSTMRARGGSRPGLVRYLGQLSPGSKIQHLDFIVDPQGMALVAPSEVETPGITYINDPSTNNLATRNPTGRRIRRGGSGAMPNRNIPVAVKRMPTIVWGALADRGIGFRLSSTELSAVAKDPVTLSIVAGSYLYSPASGTVIASGANALGVTFTPTNTAFYNNGTGTNSVNGVNTTNYDNEMVLGHGFSSAGAASDAASISCSGVVLSLLDSDVPSDYDDVLCASRWPAGDTGGPRPSAGVYSLIAIIWVPAAPGSAFPGSGTFYWDYAPS